MAQILKTQPKALPTILLMLYTLLTGVGCSQPQTITDGRMDVEIAGKTFDCEIVADQDSRTKGLGDRTEMDPREGMLFSFPDSKIRTFVMRDCYIDIDIIFLDSAGRVVATHAMKVEEPRREDESQLQYELRLKKYPSRFNAQYVIELKGGMLETLDIEAGDQIDLNTEALQEITT